MSAIVITPEKRAALRAIVRQAVLEASPTVDESQAPFASLYPQTPTLDKLADLITTSDAIFVLADMLAGGDE